MPDIDAASALKASTGPWHDVVENCPIFSKLMKCDARLTDYISALHVLYRFYSIVESRLSAFSHIVHSQPRYAHRLPALSSDLISLGELPSVTSPRTDYVLNSLGAAWGCRYVIDGSSMGTVHMARIMRVNLGDKLKGHMAFFDAQAEHSLKWGDVRTEMQRYLSTNNALGTAIDQARVTFELLHTLASSSR